MFVTCAFLIPRWSRGLLQFSAGKLQEGKGTGLGLSIAKRLVELHGGTIGCSSTLGQGSEFFFTVPCDIVQAGTDHFSSSQSSIDMTLEAPLILQESELTGMESKRVLDQST